MGTHIVTWGILDKFVSREDKDLIWKTLKEGSWYFNKLVESERWRRQEYRSERSRIAPVIAPQLAELEDRDAEDLSKEDVALLRKLRKQIAESDQLVLIARDLDEQVAQRKKELRPKLYWGQYLLEDAAFKPAVKTKGVGPNFRRANGSGRVGVGQITLENLKFIDGTQNYGVLHLTPHPWPGTSGKVVRIRVGTNDDRPCWANLCVKIHRELPEDAVIKLAWVRLRRCGGRTRYDLQLAVESKSYDPRPAVDESIVAIDIGWKRERDNDGKVLEGKSALLRVASYGDDTAVNHLHLPWKNCGAKFRDIKSIRDRLCTEERHRVWAERERLQTASPEVAEHLHYMADPDPHGGEQKGRWRSTTALAKLYRLLGEKAPEHLTAWWHRDKHLWQYEAGDSRTALARRKHIYRQFARRLERQYSYCVLENFRIANVQRKKGSGSPRKPNAGRVLASPSELVGILKEVFGPERLLEVDPRNTSRICTACGLTCAGSSELILVCEHCTHEEDRDCRGVQNILQRGRERLSAHLQAAGARKQKQQEKEAKKHQQRVKGAVTRRARATARKMPTMAAE